MKKTEKHIFSSFLEREENIKYVVILGLVLILLIFLSSTLPKKTKSEVGDKKERTEENSSDYTAYLEGKIHKIVSSVKDVGEVEVLITLEGSEEVIYAQQEKKNTDITESDGSSSGSKRQQRDAYEKGAIIVDNTSRGKEALVEKKIQPKVQGVVIVCQGGENPLVQIRVREIVMTALEIPSTKVCITVKE